MDTEMGQVMV